MNLKRLYARLAVCSIFLGLAAGTHAAEPASIGPKNLLTFDQALDVDAQGMAQALGITPQEAKRRLNIQLNAGDVAENIRKTHADRLAGVYIEHEPVSRLVVRLTGSEPVRPEFHQFSGDVLEVAYVPGAEHTFAELQKLFDTKFAALRDRVPGVQGGYVDERTGNVVIEVLRGTQFASRTGTAQAVERHFGVKARVVELDEPTVQQAVFGSGHLDYQRAAGWFICTGGFVVQQASTGRYGLLTAGHCQPTSGLYNYLGLDGATATITHVARQYSNIADIGWATTGTNISDVGPWFYANAWRQLTGRRTRVNTMVGDQICRYGRSGGYGCATVFSAAYNPGSICGPNVPGNSPCASTFVGLNSPVNLCQGGDSGGPWFISTVAAGVHTAGNPSAGLCVYTSTDYAYSHLALQLLY